MANQILTIGHSNHAIEAFLQLLTDNSVELVGDVRSTPRSRFHPQFNKDELRTALGDARIEYAFLGRGLGGRPKSDQYYSAGTADYERMATNPQFQNDLRRIIRGSGRQRIALLCAEKDPMVCHRGLLIARHLVEHGINLVHILGDGSREQHQDAEERLLREMNLQHGNLFKSRGEVLSDAYYRRATEIAFSKANTGGSAGVRTA